MDKAINSTKASSPMTPRHLEKQPLTVSAFEQNTAYHKLSLISTLLFYMARDELDLSQAAIMGMVGIVNEVAETLKPQEEVRHECC
jgi:hypothetical protein